MNRFRDFLCKKHWRCVENWEISFEELKKKVKNGAVLIDVRSFQEYNEGHLYDAVQMADYEISAKHDLIIPNKFSDVVVYCQNGGRGKKAYHKLTNLGYVNVYNLCGGLDNV